MEGPFHSTVEDLGREHYLRCSSPNGDIHLIVYETKKYPKLLSHIFDCPVSDLSLNDILYVSFSPSEFVLYTSILEKLRELKCPCQIFQSGEELETLS